MTRLTRNLSKKINILAPNNTLNVLFGAGSTLTGWRWVLGGRGVEKVRLANIKNKKCKKKTYLRPKERVRRVLWTQKTYISPKRRVRRVVWGCLGFDRG